MIVIAKSWPVKNVVVENRKYDFCAIEIVSNSGLYRILFRSFDIQTNCPDVCVWVCVGSTLNTANYTALFRASWECAALHRSTHQSYMGIRNLTSSIWQRVNIRNSVWFWWNENRICFVCDFLSEMFNRLHTCIGQNKYNNKMYRSDAK